MNMCSAQEVLKTLVRHLSERGEVVSTSEHFASLCSNAERVRFVSGLLERFELWPRVSASGEKSDELSGEYREMGNGAFKKKENGEALEMYTKGVAVAVGGSEALGLAFANRSAVLFERKLYKECLQDIQNALANNYPSRLSEKLQNRRSKAESLLSKQPHQQYYSRPPSLSAPPHPLIQCASDCVEIKETETMGRHVVAAKNIRAGDVIAIEEPFAKIVLKERRLDHCHHCLKLCCNLLPCPKCTEALFCSKTCLEEALELYHKYECPVLAFLYNFNLSKLELLALRVVLLARDCDLTKPSEVYKSGRYEEIHHLVTNTEKRTIPDLFAKTATAAILTKVFEKHTTLLQDDASKDVFSERLLRHLQTAPSNFHEISECVGSATKCYATEDIGSGAFSFLSLFNHSCSPNIVRHCHGFTVVLRALRPVKKGEQLFDNYGYHHALMAKSERQEHLKAQYLFQCACKTCEEDWPLYHDLKQLDYHLELEPKYLKALREGSCETARVVVDDLIEKLEELEETIPSRNLADAQEIVKQCFALFGNKRTLF